MTVTADELGTQDKTLDQTSLPFYWNFIHVGNILIDTIFVGQWIGSLAIAAVTVVLPITFDSL
jgi:Na+-driven multidrug efflux pump